MILKSEPSKIDKRFEIFKIKSKTKCPIGFKLLWRLRFCYAVFFFFFHFSLHLLTFPRMNSAFVHYLQTYKFYFSVTFSLKMGSTVLFTHLKIILLIIILIINNIKINKLNLQNIIVGTQSICPRACSFCKVPHRLEKCPLML